MVNKIEDEDARRFAQPPPEGFNSDYAKFLLAMEEARRPKPWTDRLPVIVALVASLGGAAVSLFNAVVYWGDRASAAHKEVFDDQISVTRIYFEKMAGGNFCDKSKDAMLYARASLAVANLKEDDIVAGLTPGGAAAVAAAGTAATSDDGVKSLARIIYKDIYQRQRDECTGQLTLVANPPSAGKTQVLEAVSAGSSDATSYNLLQTAPNSGAPSSGGYTVYIQYLEGSASRDRALAIQALLQKDKAFTAPGTQSVKAVPNHDQIRIYRSQDKDEALALQAKLGLKDASIISLQKAYPNLPAGVLEVWLGKPDPGGVAS